MPLQLFEKNLQAFTRLLTVSLPGLQCSWEVASEATEPNKVSVLELASRLEGTDG